MALVYRKDTGERVQVPDHWMDHKTLSRPFRKTPPTTGGTQKAPATGTNPKKED